ncbi:MAG: hypothetical protein ACRC2R_15130 [Xenococcaceae cyanobacterium]
MKQQLITWLNRFLVADVFLVIFAFIWFAVALIGRSLNIPLGWEIWYKLWLPLFNPAIGILFLGAIASWLISKISEKFSPDRE